MTRGTLTPIPEIRVGSHVWWTAVNGIRHGDVIEISNGNALVTMKNGKSVIVNYKSVIRSSEHERK